MAYNAQFYQVLRPCEYVVCFTAVRYIRNYIILNLFSTQPYMNPFAAAIMSGNLNGFSQ